MTLQAVHHTILFSELGLTLEHIEKNLGYQQGAAPDHVYQLIEDMLKESEERSRLEGGYCLYERLELSPERKQLLLGGRKFEVGKIISSQFDEVSGAAVFLCTAGRCMSQWSRELFQQGEELRGYLADTIASETVEKAMDWIHDLLKTQMKEQGLGLTNRFSPGYCGWPVSDQKPLFKLLPDNFCSVGLTESCLMIPLKSVSGIIGTGRGVKPAEYPCRVCETEDCLYRNLR